MFIKHINSVFLVGIILYLVLNPFLSVKTLSREKQQIIKLHEKIITKNGHDKRESYSPLFSEVKGVKSTPFFPKSCIQPEKALPPSTGKIIGELLLGSIGSIGFGIAGASIGISTSNDEEMFAGWGEAILGYFIGSNIGSTIGVYAIGASGEKKGSFGSTLGGSLLGTAVGIGLLYMTDDNTNIGFIGFTLAQSAGAIIAYNASVRKKTKHVPNEALLQIKEDKWSLSYPEIHLKPHPVGQDHWITTVNLVKVEF